MISGMDDLFVKNVRCLSVLGIVRKNRRMLILLIGRPGGSTVGPFSKRPLFFLYESLCTSSHDLIKDYPWSA